MKNLDVFEVKNYVDKWFSNSNFITQIQGRADSSNLQIVITFVSHKLQEHLNFSNTFLYLFHNCDVTSSENIQSHFESIQSAVEKSTCSFKSM